MKKKKKIKNYNCNNNYKVYPSFINNIIVILIWKIILLELVK